MAKRTPQPPAAGKRLAVSGKKAKRTPQPPPQYPAPVAASPAQQTNLQYNQPLQQQLQQPYSDLMTTMGYGAAPAMAQNFGGLQGYTGQTGGQAGATESGYGTLMPASVQNLQSAQQELNDIYTKPTADFDPYLQQQLNDQEQGLHSQLLQQLGPDYATSSAGIEALAKFNQYAMTARTSAQFNRATQLQDQIQQYTGGYSNQAVNQGQLYGQNIGGVSDLGYGFFNQGQNAAANQLSYLNNWQAVAGAPAAQMGNFGQTQAGMAGQTMQQTGPYQSDRFTQLGTQYTPTSGQMWGAGLQNSASRLISSGGQMMGAGTNMMNNTQQG